MQKRSIRQIFGERDLNTHAKKQSKCVEMQKRYMWQKKPISLILGKRVLYIYICKREIEKRGEKESERDRNICTYIYIYANDINV